MFKYGCWTLLLCSLVGAQPLSCEEDAHCSQGYYCQTQDKMCSQCLQCEDLNRLTPLLPSLDSCVTSVLDCGPCFKGFVNGYEADSRGMCVSSDWVDNGDSTAFCFYIWITAAIVGFLLVAIFLYVIWNTYVFQISPYYYPVYTIKPNEFQCIVTRGCAFQEYTTANVVHF